MYVGSAQAQKSGHSALAGESQRLTAGHETMFQLSPDDLSGLRKKPGSGALYVHEVGVRVGVRRTYYSTASFPVITSSSLFQARIKQSIQRLENDQVIFLASLGIDKQTGNLAHRKQASRVYMEVLRPSSWPSPPWAGLNKVLPSTQSLVLVSHEAPTTTSDLYDVLRQFYGKSGRLHLGASDLRIILDENKGHLPPNWHDLPEYIRFHLTRGYYNNVLQENGMAYENYRSQSLRTIFPILWGLAQHFTESGLILGERNSEYILC